jgi:hypothetical protein
MRIDATSRGCKVRAMLSATRVSAGDRRHQIDRERLFPDIARELIERFLERAPSIVYGARGLTPLASHGDCAAVWERARWLEA